jgi:hypothetical protein
VDIKRKKKLKDDKSTPWCLRQWCQGAALGNGYLKVEEPLELMGEVYETKKASVLTQGMSAMNLATEEEEQEDEIAKDKKFLQIVSESARTATTRSASIVARHGTATITIAGHEWKAQWSAQRYPKNTKRHMLISSYIPRPVPHAQRPFKNWRHVTICGAGNAARTSAPCTHFTTEGTKYFQNLCVLEESDNGALRGHFGGERGAEVVARQAAIEEEERRRTDAVPEVPGGMRIDSPPSWPYLSLTSSEK